MNLFLFFCFTLVGRRIYSVRNKNKITCLSTRHTISTMTNTKPQKKPTHLRRKPPARTANNAQAREAARVQKKAAHGRGQQVAIGANDENDDPAVPSKPNRHSSRLNCMERGVTEGGGDLSTSAKPKVGRPTGTASSKRRGMTTLGASRILRTPTPENEDAQSDGSVGLDEIYDLQRQLQEEKGEAPHCSLMKPFDTRMIQKRTGFYAALARRRLHARK